MPVEKFGEQSSAENIFHSPKAFEILGMIANSDSKMDLVEVLKEVIASSMHLQHDMTTEITKDEAHALNEIVRLEFDLRINE